MKFLEILRLLWQAIVAWWNDNAMRLGASVAYYTLFAIAPILLVATAVAGSLFGAEAVRGEIVGQIDQLVGTEGGKAVQALLQGATRKEREHPRDDDWRHHLCAGGMRRVSGAASRTRRDLASKAGARRGPAESILSRSGCARLGLWWRLASCCWCRWPSMPRWRRSRPGSRRGHRPCPIILYALNFLLSVAVTATLFGLLFKFLPDVELKWRDVATGRNRHGAALHCRQTHHRPLPGAEHARPRATAPPVR